MNKNKPIKGYLQWLTEDSQNQLSAANEIKFNFNFESGKYKKEEIPESDLVKLKSDLNKPISLIKVPKFENQKTTLTLIASTSTLGLKPELKSQLQKEGFKPTGNGNDALCEARLKTLEQITISYFCEKLKCDPTQLATKVIIKKISKPNSGSGSTDEERKAFQYISIILDQTGTVIPLDRRIDCNMKPSSRKGVQAKKDSNYVGYSANQIIVIPSGSTITIKLNPITVPDMVYFKYKDSEFLSPWLGSKIQTRPDGSVRYYEKELNDSSKIPGLKDAINSEIAKVGGKLTVESVLAKNGGYLNGKFIVLPGPDQKGDPGIFSFTLTKGFDLDNLTIRVFSPLDGTAFSLSTSCITATN